MLDPTLGRAAVLPCCRAAGWGKLHRGPVRPFQGAVDAVGQDMGPISLWIL